MSRKTKVLKVILIGDSNAGKTSLMKRFEYNSFNDHLQATIGMDILEKDVIVDRETYTLNIWDTAGQERYKSVTRPYYKGADCGLLTFALDDMRSFENLSEWKNEFLYYANIPDGENFPFVIVGNKVDNKDKRVVIKRMVKDWCNKNRINLCLYYETSAKDATNVDEAFIAAVERYKELETREKHNSKRYKEEGVDLSETPRKQKSSCCLNFFFKITKVSFVTIQTIVNQQ